jgi:hypothetical protein
MKIRITESQIKKIKENIFWDEENLNALKSITGTKQQKEVYNVEVSEPFSITMTNSVDYHRLVFILRTNGVKVKGKVINI